MDLLDILTVLVFIWMVVALTHVLNKSFIERARAELLLYKCITDDFSLAVYKPVKNYNRDDTPEFTFEQCKEILERDGKECVYCNREVRFKPKNRWLKAYDVLNHKRKNVYIEYDHIIPKYYGGESTVNNGCVSCRGCNRRKSYKIELPFLPKVIELVELYQPDALIWAGCFKTV
jgi:hypothetical protein